MARGRKEEQRKAAGNSFGNNMIEKQELSQSRSRETISPIAYQVPYRYLP